MQTAPSNFRDLSRARLTAGLLVFCTAVSSNVTLADEYLTTPGSEVLVSNMPPPRDQGELAFCYAAVPTILLERERCQQQGMDCSALGPDQQYSLLHVSAMRFRVPRFLQEYGDLNGVLVGLRNQQKQGITHLASESCVPYASLARLDMPERPAHHHLRAGWEYLQELHEKMQRNGPPACVDCEIRTLRSRLGLRTGTQQLRALLQRDLRRQPLEENDWIWRAAMPESCMQDIATQVELPAFRWRAWPEQEDAATHAGILNQVRKLLRRDTPVSLAYCSAWDIRDENARCRNRGGHASVITGMRQVCSSESGECWDVFRVQNSFGSAWQEKSYQTWLLADELISAALEMDSRRYFLTWLESP